MPAIPSSLLEPVWVEFAALLPPRGEFHPDHPLGCHRRRIPDRVVFEHLVDALVHGSGYERIVQWAVFGLRDASSAQGVVWRRYRRAGPPGGVGRLRPDHRPTVDRHSHPWVYHHGALRRRQGWTVSCGQTKRWTETISNHRRRWHTVGTRFRRRQPPRLAAAGPDPARGHYPGRPTLAERHHRAPGRRLRLTGHPRSLLDELGMHGEIARKGVPAPVQVGKRWSLNVPRRG